MKNLPLMMILLLLAACAPTEGQIRIAITQHKEIEHPPSSIIKASHPSPARARPPKSASSSSTAG